MGSVIGFILADTHLLDLLMVLSLYFNLPKVNQFNLIFRLSKLIMFPPIFIH